MFRITTLSGEGKCDNIEVFDVGIITLLCHLCEEPKEMALFLVRLGKQRWNN